MRENNQDKVGKFWGIPYDWRKPTKARYRSRVWNPQEPKIMTPKAFGWGYDLNFYRLFHPSKKADKLTLMALLVSAFSILCLLIANQITAFKANEHVFEALFSMLIVIISVALFMFIYARSRSLIKAGIIASVLPMIIFGYSAITNYLDMHHAKHEPNSIYFKN